ncbi:hypothetical protein C2S52_023096 [Perilla frutescens var. hirtella]|nr:hypothetical protein C2S52_023096 [Perilla frutescens var. hirtella]
MVRTRDPIPSVVDFTKLLSSVVKMKQCSVALSLFDEMLQRNAPVNHYTLAIDIDCFCRLKRVGYGFAIMGIQIKYGYEPPNVITFNNLIKGLFLVVKVYSKLLREKLCEPNEVTYLIVINGLCKASHTLPALDLLGFLEKESYNPNLKVYTTVIDSLCEEGMVMERDGRSIEKDGGLVEEAEHILEIMKQIDVQPDMVTYCTLMDRYCIARKGGRGRVEEVEHILEIMKQIEVQPNMVTYCTLMDGYCLRGEIDEAKRIWGLAVDSGHKPDFVIKGLERDVVTYTAMLQGLFREGRCEDGLKLFKEMQARKIVQLNVVTFSILIGALCKEGLIQEEAKDLLTQMANRGCSPDSVTYNVYVQGIVKRDETADAIPVLEEMKVRGFKLHATTFSVLLRHLEVEG